MTRVWDTFMFAGELDMLECRLTELEPVPDLVHVIVEAGVTHRGDRKPLHYHAHRDRFARWEWRIRYVTVPTLPDDPDPWVREHAQREHAWRGLAAAVPGDVILHGDVDEIPAVAAVKAVTRDLAGPVVFGQRHFMYAADWQYPVQPWPGTIACPLGAVQGFQWLRAQRFTLPLIPDGGWHLSWMGGLDAQRAKLGVHCHLEMTPAEQARIATGAAWRDGTHHGGQQMIPVEIDQTWPRWVAERRCPPSWFRPRQTGALAALAGMVTQ